MHQHKTPPESTMMSSSSPDPSSSLNTTCFPWRNTVLFPEKPSTFCTFTTPSSRSRPSQCRRSSLDSSLGSSLGSSLQRGGLGRCWGWRGMLISSSGSSLIVRPPKEKGDCSSGTVEWVCWLSSPAWSSLSFLLFFFFSLSAFLRSSGCRVVIVCCTSAKKKKKKNYVKMTANLWFGLILEADAQHTVYIRLMRQHQHNSHLSWCDWTVWPLAVDVSCSCPGGPWRGAVGRRVRVPGSSHHCQLCCLYCWGGWNYCAVASPVTWRSRGSVSANTHQETQLVIKIS